MRNELLSEHGSLVFTSTAIPSDAAQVAQTVLSQTGKGSQHGSPGQQHNRGSQQRFEGRISQSTWIAKPSAPTTPPSPFPPHLPRPMNDIICSRSPFVMDTPRALPSPPLVAYLLLGCPSHRWWQGSVPDSLHRCRCSAPSLLRLCALTVFHLTAM